MTRFRIVAFSRERERERVKRGSHSSFDDIISVDNLLTAWNEFLRGKRKRKDVAEFSLHLLDNIFNLHGELSDKTYRHGGYQAFKVNDPKPRDIHKASVRDRLVHHAIYRILYPCVDRGFIFDSYSCRRKKGTHRAIDRFRLFAGKVSQNHTRTTWVLKCDIRRFFANIDHEILSGILERSVADPEIVWLLRQIIGSFHTNGRIGIGLPLGNLTSQLLINVYMDTFDQFVKRNLHVHHYVRYADDFVILSADREYLEKILVEIADFLWRELRLQLHPRKVEIRTLASGVDFLGWIHFPRHRVLRTSTKKRITRAVRDGVSKESVASYGGLLKHGNAYGIAREILRWRSG